MSLSLTFVCNGDGVCNRNGGGGLMQKKKTLPRLPRLPQLIRRPLLEMAAEESVA